MSTPTSLKNLHTQVVSNGVSLVTILTHGTGLCNPDASLGYGGVLDRLDIYNADTVQHVVKVYRVPAAGSAGVTNLIGGGPITIPAGGGFILEGPFYATDSWTYQAQLGEAKTTTEVTFQADYHEMKP